MKYFAFATLINLGFTIAVPDVWSQGPPINTNTAFVVGLEGAAVRSFGKYMSKSGSLSNGTHGDVTVWAVPVMVPYELILNKLVVGAAIPDLNKRMKISENGKTVKELSSSGIGDLKLIAKFQFLQIDAFGKTTRTTFISGITIPVGERNQKDSQGNKLPPGLQPGSGSTAFSGGVIFTHVVNRLGFNLDWTILLTSGSDG